MVDAFRASGVGAAGEIFTKYLPLIVFEQQPGVGILKETLRLRGLLTSNRVRHANVTIDADTSKQLRTLLNATFRTEDISRVLDVAPSWPFIVNI